MSNEKQRNRPASRQLQDKVGGVAPAGLSPDGNETWRWLPFWCARWEWLSAALLKLIRQYARSMEGCAQTASRYRTCPSEQDSGNGTYAGAGWSGAIGRGPCGGAGQREGWIW